jgi:hypothetical protein
MQMETVTGLLMGMRLEKLKMNETGLDLLKVKYWVKQMHSGSGMEKLKEKHSVMRMHLETGLAKRSVILTAKLMRLDFERERQTEKHWGLLMHSEIDLG